MPKPPAPPDVLREMKQQVAAGIIARFDGWTQEGAAVLLHTWQPRMSDLRNHRLDAFSLDQLLRYTARLDVVIRLEIEWLDNQRYVFPSLPPTRIEARFPQPSLRRRPGA